MVLSLFVFVGVTFPETHIGVVSKSNLSRPTPNTHDRFELGLSCGAESLNYMKGRFQLPNFAKFNRPDPMRDWNWLQPHTINLYEYVGNDPINKWDPTGYGETLGQYLKRKFMEALDTGQSKKLMLRAMNASPEDPKHVQQAKEGLAEKFDEEVMEQSDRFSTVLQYSYDNSLTLFAIGIALEPGSSGESSQEGAVEDDVQPEESDTKLTPAQQRRVDKVSETKHMLESRDNLSGDNLDEGHQEKLDNARRGLEKHRDALRRSTENPNQDPEVKRKLNESADDADSLIKRINELIPPDDGE